MTDSKTPALTLEEFTAICRKYGGTGLDEAIDAYRTRIEENAALKEESELRRLNLDACQTALKEIMAYTTRAAFDGEQGRLKEESHG